MGRKLSCETLTKNRKALVNKLSIKMNCGDIATLIEYNTSTDIKVQFTTGQIVKANFYNFENGKIKSNFYPSFFGFGILGQEAVSDNNGEPLGSFNSWRNMIKRCYGGSKSSSPSYSDCYVCEEWRYFKNFKDWYNDNYYQLGDERMELDKDILVKNNKVYSPSTCIFVPKTINTPLAGPGGNVAKRDTPVGIFVNKDGSYFSRFGKNRGKEFWNLDEAISYYKSRKKARMVEIAERYKSKYGDDFPKIIYDTLINYEVDMVYRNNNKDNKGED